MSQPKSNVKPATVRCETCGEPFVPGRRRGARPQKFCNPKCRYRAHNKRQYEKHRRRCPRCGEFVDSGAHQGAPCRACRVEERRELYERIERLWHDGRTIAEVGDALGVSVGRAGHLVLMARDAGFDIGRRYTLPPPPTQDVRAVAKQFKREPLKVQNTWRLRDKQKTILRLLQVAPEPVAALHVSRLLERLPVKLKGRTHWQGVYQSLVYLHRRGLVERVEQPRGNHYHARFLWLIPARIDLPVLTLADARQERELAVLIREQEAEQRRGEWAAIDPRTTSLDAVRGEGATLHEFLEDAS